MKTIKHSYETLNDYDYNISLTEEAIEELEDDYGNLSIRNVELQKENNDLWGKVMDLYGQVDDLEDELADIEITQG